MLLFSSTSVLLSLFSVFVCVHKSGWLLFGHFDMLVSVPFLDGHVNQQNFALVLIHGHGYLLSRANIFVHAITA